MEAWWSSRGSDPDGPVITMEVAVLTEVDSLYRRATPHGGDSLTEKVVLTGGWFPFTEVAVLTEVRSVQR